MIDDDEGRAATFRAAIRERLPDLVAMSPDTIACWMAEMMSPIERDDDRAAGDNAITMLAFLLWRAARETFTRGTGGIPLPLPFSPRMVWFAPHRAGAPN